MQKLYNLLRGYLRARTTSNPYPEPPTMKSFVLEMKVFVSSRLYPARLDPCLSLIRMQPSLQRIKTINVILSSLLLYGAREDERKSCKNLFLLYSVALPGHTQLLWFQKDRAIFHAHRKHHCGFLFLPCKTSISHYEQSLYHQVQPSNSRKSTIYSSFSHL